MHNLKTYKLCKLKLDYYLFFILLKKHYLINLNESYCCEVYFNGLFFVLNLTNLLKADILITW